MQNWGLPTDTKRFFNVVVALGFTLLVVWLFVISQTGPQPQEVVTPQQQEKLDSLRKALGTEARPISQDESPDLFDNAITTFILLAGGLAVLWFWSRRQGGTTGNGGQLFKQVGQQDLGPGQSIKVIEMQDSYWILGVTNNGINLLDKMDKEEWDPDLVAATDNKPSFSNLLNQFRKGDENKAS